ncbi:MAG: hypothetical protein NC254_07525 [bacterium]|nr:hypothetical protein [bacterium]
MLEPSVAYAAVKDATFIVDDETVYASLSGDANGVTGKTSYTKGPGVLELIVGGSAKIPGTTQVRGLVAMPNPVNAPGGISTTMTPPSGHILISAYSHHYATIGGASNYCDLTLF